MIIDAARDRHGQLRVKPHVVCSAFLSPKRRKARVVGLSSFFHRRAQRMSRFFSREATSQVCLLARMLAVEMADCVVVVLAVFSSQALLSLHRPRFFQLGFTVRPVKLRFLFSGAGASEERTFNFPDHDHICRGLAIRLDCLLPNQYLAFGHLRDGLLRTNVLRPRLASVFRTWRQYDCLRSEVADGSGA